METQREERGRWQGRPLPQRAAAPGTGGGSCALRGYGIISAWLGRKKERRQDLISWDGRLRSWRLLRKRGLMRCARSWADRLMVFERRCTPASHALTKNSLPFAQNSSLSAPTSRLCRRLSDSTKDTQKKSTTSFNVSSRSKGISASSTPYRNSNSRRHAAFACAGRPTCRSTLYFL